MSVFGVILVCIFPHSEIRRISPYFVQMQENADQNNSESGYFLRSVWQNVRYHEIIRPIFQKICEEIESLTLEGLYVSFQLFLVAII